MPSRSGSATPLLIGPVHAGQQIDDFEVAPVGVDRLLVLRAAARAAAVVHLQHGVAVGREDLADVVEAVVVLAVGAAVDPEDQSAACRQAQPAGLASSPLTTVPSFAVNVTSSMLENATSPTHASLCVVILPQRAAFGHVDLVRRAGRRRQHRHRRRRSRATASRRRDGPWSAARPSRRPRHAREVLDAIVFDGEVEALAVGRPLRRRRPSDRATR